MLTKEGLPLQYDLFTGELVDNRTRSQKQSERQREQPQQTEMFAQREIAQFGVCAHPQFSLSPDTKLVLISEDPRTPEEIEHDLEREAQTLTVPLFADTPPSSPATPISLQQPDLLVSPPPLVELDELCETDDDEEVAEEIAPAKPLPSKYAAYMQLVKMAQEQAETVAACTTAKIAQSVSLCLAQFEAKHAGLTEAERDTATTIGTFLGQKQTDQQKEQPQQVEMSAQREATHLGISAHPQISLPSETKPVLICEDPRTPEEKERDLQRQAEALTVPLFEGDKATSPEKCADQKPPHEEVTPLELPPPGVGFRKWQRQKSINVRQRIFEPLNAKFTASLS